MTAAGLLALLWETGCSSPSPGADAGAADLAAEVRERAGEPGVTLVNDRERDAFVMVIGPVALPAGDDHDHGGPGAGVPPAGEESGEHPLDEPTHHGAHAPVWPPWERSSCPWTPRSTASSGASRMPGGTTSPRRSSTT